MANVYEIITDRILDSLSKGVVPWRKPWHTETPKNLVSGKGYRGVNVLLLEAAPYESRYWVTFNPGPVISGAGVRKGERGTPVVFWKITEEKDAKGRPTRASSFATTDRIQRQPVRWCASSPALQRPAFGSIPHRGMWRLSFQGFMESPASPTGRPCNFYSPVEDLIQIPACETFHSAPEYYSTLFHELGHSTGAHDRLARKTVTDPISYASHSYSFEELIAECTAAFLCSQGGIAASTLDNSAAYIASWSKVLRADLLARSSRRPLRRQRPPI